MKIILAAYLESGATNQGIELSRAGLRAENRHVRKLSLVETNERNPRKYTNLFPSAHLTFIFLRGNMLFN